jgi:hypothetical protein
MSGSLCTSCGEPVSAGLRFCTSCGRDVGLRCPKCGHENAEETRFCTGCGESLGGARVAALPAQSVGPTPATPPPRIPLAESPPPSIPKFSGRPPLRTPTPPPKPHSPPVAAPPPRTPTPPGPHPMRRKTDRLTTEVGEVLQSAIRPSGIDERLTAPPGAVPPAVTANGAVLQSAIEPSGIDECLPAPPKAAPPAVAVNGAEALFEQGEFRRAYALLTGVESAPEQLQSEEQLKAACLFWMGRLAEAESLCMELLQRARSGQVEAMLNQIPGLRRAQAGYTNESEQRSLPTLHRHVPESPEGPAVLRGSCQCYHCSKRFNVHNPASIVSPRPSLNPVLCPHCFGLNEVFCRSFGCPNCHGRLSVNARWEGLQVVCPWCREPFDLPARVDLAVIHNRERPFCFPGRSANASLSTPEQEAALTPMQFGSIGEVETQLLRGRLPPWTACYRGDYDVERPLTQVASDYFCLRRHFDPRGAYSMLAGTLAWITAPMLGVALFEIDVLLLQPLTSYSEAILLVSVVVSITAWLMILTTPLRLGGWLLEATSARLSAVLATLLLTVDRVARLGDGAPSAVVFLVRLMILPATLTLTIPALAGGLGRALRMLFTALAYGFTVWPVRVALGIARVRRRRTVLWEAERDDGFPFHFRPLYLEGLQLPAGGRLGGLLRQLL